MLRLISIYLNQSYDLLIAMDSISFHIARIATAQCWICSNLIYSGIDENVYESVRNDDTGNNDSDTSNTTATF